MVDFPLELDSYLDFCAEVYNFDFQAISSEFVASASGLIKHPFADEPEDLLQARAKELFSPEALRARWEMRHGVWEVIADAAEDWEVLSQGSKGVLTSDGIHVNFEEETHSLCSFCMISDAVEVHSVLSCSCELEEEDEPAAKLGDRRILPPWGHLDPSFARILGFMRTEYDDDPDDDSTSSSDSECEQVRRQGHHEWRMQAKALAGRHLLSA